MRVWLCGGGTGGHISPALSLYREFEKRGYSPLLITGFRDTIMLPANAKRQTLSVVPPRKRLTYPIFVFKMFLALIKSIFLVIKERPQIVIGMGGYVSLPPLIAAVIFRKPIVICEQNSVAGKANRLMSKFAKTVYHSFSYSKRQIKKGIVSGNPVRNSFYETTRESARKSLEIDEKQKVLLIMGGSQGAKELNRKVLDSAKKINENVENLVILWTCGRFHYDSVKEEVKNRSLNFIRLYPYYAKPEELIFAADFAVSRAGSSSISEYIVASLPALYIPFPYATDDHQYYNAKEIADVKAGFIVREEEINSDSLVEICVKTLSSEEELKNMRESFASLKRKREAHNIIADDIERLIKG